MAWPKPQAKPQPKPLSLCICMYICIYKILPKSSSHSWFLSQPNLSKGTLVILRPHSSSYPRPTNPSYHHLLGRAFLCLCNTTTPSPPLEYLLFSRCSCPQLALYYSRSLSFSVETARQSFLLVLELLATEHRMSVEIGFKLTLFFCRWPYVCLLPRNHRWVSLALLMLTACL